MPSIVIHRALDADLQKGRVAVYIGALTCVGDGSSCGGITCCGRESLGRRLFDGHRDECPKTAGPQALVWRGVAPAVLRYRPLGVRVGLRRRNRISSNLIHAAMADLAEDEHIGSRAACHRQKALRLRHAATHKAAEFRRVSLAAEFRR